MKISALSCRALALAGTTSAALIVSLATAQPALADDCLLDTNNDGEVTATGTADTDGNASSKAMTPGWLAVSRPMPAARMRLLWVAGQRLCRRDGGRQQHGRKNAVALGNDADAGGTNAIAIGGDTNNNGIGAIASAADAVAIGADSSVTANSGIAIGSRANVANTVDGGVALGHNTIVGQRPGVADRPGRKLMRVLMQLHQDLPSRHLVRAALP